MTDGSDVFSYYCSMICWVLKGQICQVQLCAVASSSIALAAHAKLISKESQFYLTSLVTILYALYFAEHIKAGVLQPVCFYGCIFQELPHSEVQCSASMAR